MKRLICALMILLLLCTAFSIFAQAEASNPAEALLSHLFPTEVPSSPAPTRGSVAGPANSLSTKTRATPTPRPSPTPSPTPFILEVKAEGNGTEDGGERYGLLIRDDIGLLSQEDIAKLEEAMRPLTAYCDVAFWATDKWARDVGNQAIDFCEKNIHQGRNYPCVLFMIKMDNRIIYLLSRGSMEKFITRSDATAVTDQAASLAKAGAYGDCACQAFSSVRTLIESGYLFSWPRFISQVIFALALSLLAAYKLVRFFTIQPFPRAYERTDFGTFQDHISYTNLGSKLISRKKTEISSSDSSCSSSCSSSSCSSGGGSSCSSGGSSCGSGGGSSF